MSGGSQCVEYLVTNPNASAEMSVLHPGEVPHIRTGVDSVHDEDAQRRVCPEGEHFQHVELYREWQGWTHPLNAVRLRDRNTINATARTMSVANEHPKAADMSHYVASRLSTEDARG